MLDHRLKYKNIGFYPDFQYDNNKFIRESDVLEHYFVNFKAIPKSLSKFVIKCEEKTNGLVFNRISKVYDHVFIDEVQDLAGHDLSIIKCFFSSNIKTLLVGDPRQVTYLTHHENKYSNYRDGKIMNFIIKECSEIKVEIDEVTLKKSHRNNSQICSFSSRLFTNFEPSEPCDCLTCRIDPGHSGIYIVKPDDVIEYLKLFKDDDKVGTLRYQKSIPPERNFGDSKGLTFNHTLVYCSDSFYQYLKDGILVKKKNDDSTKDVDAFDIF